MFKQFITYLTSLNAFQRARLSTVAIMAAAAYVSYGHQRTLLLDHGASGQAAAIVPLTVDLLAITCTILVHVKDISRYGFWVALLTLILAVGVSGAANWLAGANDIDRAANLWTVVAYLLSELVTATAKSRKSPARVQGGVKAAQTRKAQAPRKATAKAPVKSRQRAPKPATTGAPSLAQAAAATA